MKSDLLESFLGHCMEYRVVKKWPISRPCIEIKNEQIHIFHAVYIQSDYS